MNFGFSEEQDLLRSSVRRFLDERCPLEEVPRLSETSPGYCDAQWAELAALGWPRTVDWSRPRGPRTRRTSKRFAWTVRATRRSWPDHGLFALGSNRLYVHRGTGFYGFPLRVGVPGEASLMELIVNEAD